MSKKEVKKMAFQNKSFVLGKEKVPGWFEEETSAGRAKVNYDDGELIDVTVYTPTGTKVAKLGDTIMLLKSGLSVITASEAKKYGVSTGKVKEEE